MDTVMTSWSTYSGADFIRLNAPHFFPSLSHIITGLFVDPKTELGKGGFRTDGWEELPHAPKPEAKGSSGEEQPHDRGQGRWPGGPTPRPRSRGCVGTGGPTGAIPDWKSGRAVVRRYPSSKVRSNGCALLEQSWRDTPRPRTETQVRW